MQTFSQDERHDTKEKYQIRFVAYEPASGKKEMLQVTDMDPNQKQDYENACKQAQVADTSRAIAKAIAEFGRQSLGRRTGTGPVMGLMETGGPAFADSRGSRVGGQYPLIRSAR